MVSMGGIRGRQRGVAKLRLRVRFGAETNLYAFAKETNGLSRGGERGGQRGVATLRPREGLSMENIWILPRTSSESVVPMGGERGRRGADVTDCKFPHCFLSTFNKIILS